MFNILFQINSGLASKYPVMFYIHGGEFIHGASNLFPAHILSGFYNVIVVTINYRLGALGESFIIQMLNAKHIFKYI
jgi:carboxylesterase type B